MDKLSEHAIRMLEIEGKGKNDGYIETRNMGDIARAVYDVILQVQMLKMADRKTESDSENPNNCETCRYEGECDWKQWQKCYCEPQSVRSNLEPFRVDEPQTDCAWMKGEE